MDYWLFLQLLFVTVYSQSVIVCTKSAIKISAVSIVTGSPAQGFKSASGIPEQPFGIVETTIGAWNRIKSVLNSGLMLQNVSDLIAIENGIVFGAEETATYCKSIKYEECSDFAAAIRYNVVKNEWFLAYSEPIIFEKDLVQTAFEVPNHSVTVGSLYAKRHPTVKADDPHLFITNGTRDRESFLTDVVTKVFEQKSRLTTDMLEELDRDANTISK